MNKLYFIIFFLVYSQIVFAQDLRKIETKGNYLNGTKFFIDGKEYKENFILGKLLIDKSAVNTLSRDIKKVGAIKAWKGNFLLG